MKPVVTLTRLVYRINANKYFGADEQHNINASAGFELSSSRYNGFKSVDRGYYPDRGKMVRQ